MRSIHKKVSLMRSEVQLCLHSGVQSPEPLTQRETGMKMQFKSREKKTQLFFLKCSSDKNSSSSVSYDDN